MAYSTPSDLARAASRAVVAALGTQVVVGTVHKAKRSKSGTAYIHLRDETGATLSVRILDCEPPAVGTVVCVSGTPTIYDVTCELQLNGIGWQPV